MQNTPSRVTLVFSLRDALSEWNRWQLRLFCSETTQKHPKRHPTGRGGKQHASDPKPHARQRERETIRPRGERDLPAHLHPQKTHHNGVDCSQNAFWVEGLHGGVSVHIITKHPSVNVSCCPPSAVWVKTTITDPTSSQIATDERDTTVTMTKVQLYGLYWK